MVVQSPDELVRVLSADLGLSYEAQDWGIVNADGERLGDFMSKFADPTLQPTQRVELAGLILASANERLLAGLALDFPRLVGLARSQESAFDVHLRYWCSLGDEDEFPLAMLLRAEFSQRFGGNRG